MIAARPPGFQQLQDQLDEEQLGLGRAQRPERGADIALVDAAGEGRVGQHHIKFLVQIAALGDALVEDAAQAVGIANVRVLQPVLDQVHPAQAHHGAVEVEAMQVVAAQLLVLVGRQAVADGVDGRAVSRKAQDVRAGVAFQDVLVGVDQKAAGAAGRVADAFAVLGIDQIAHRRG